MRALGIQPLSEHWTDIPEIASSSRTGGHFCSRNFVLGKPLWPIFANFVHVLQFVYEKVKLNIFFNGRKRIIIQFLPRQLGTG